jgi:glutamate synthase (NADPH/NADH) small chain
MVQKMRLGAPDATGRQSPEVIEGADYVEPADLVVQALGFEPEDLPTCGACRNWVTRWGTIKADFRSHATSLPGVYAVGDIVRGASLVVWAIRDGREAAEAILSEQESVFLPSSFCLPCWAARRKRRRFYVRHCDLIRQGERR